MLIVCPRHLHYVGNFTHDCSCVWLYTFCGYIFCGTLFNATRLPIYVVVCDPWVFLPTYIIMWVKIIQIRGRWLQFNHKILLLNLLWMVPVHPFYVRVLLKLLTRIGGDLELFFLGDAVDKSLHSNKCTFITKLWALIFSKYNTNYYCNKSIKLYFIYCRSQAKHHPSKYYSIEVYTSKKYQWVLIIYS